MTAHHYVEVEVEDEDTPDAVYTVVRFTCTAPAGSLCRAWCIEPECEDECTGTPVLGGRVELVAQAPIDGHWYEPIDYCRIAECLGAGGAGDREELHGEDEALRPGLHPIEEEWDGDTYLWRYAEPEPEPAYPGRPL